MKPHRGRIISTIIMVLSGNVAIYALTFFLTATIYRLLGFQLDTFISYLINIVLSMFLGIAVLSGISAFIRARGLGKRMDIFGPLIEAMQRIAKGDFSVKLDNTFQEDDPFGELVNSVNTMALELNQMEAMRQEFISNVSHEIQSPLTSIRGFARALHSDQLSREEHAHYLTIIEQESMRLSKLSDNLLQLASLDSEQLQVEPQRYRLDRQIRAVILACEPQWSHKALDIEVALEEVAILADEDLLGQVWTNLIHNSIKFTPAGGQVRVRLYPGERVIDVEITDTGIGIANDDQAYIFERFFKADRSRERAQGGNGLGLAIAKKIVDLHHGNIVVRSTLNVGTTFIVSLPNELSQAYGTSPEP